MKKNCLLPVFVILTMTFANSAFAIKPIYSGGKERAAIRGYDTVSYFTENKPVKGSPQFLLEYEGATWFFSSASNLKLFKDNPKKYMPQYGGYCAYAVARSTTASIKPEYFTIYKGKLYLNYSKSVFKKWTKRKKNYTAKADENWPVMLHK